MEKCVYTFLDHLFMLAERVADKYSHIQVEKPTMTNPVPVSETKPMSPTIRFSSEDKMVEGDLFK